MFCQNQLKKPLFLRLFLLYWYDKVVHICNFSVKLISKTSIPHMFICFLLKSHLLLIQHNFVM